jgi:probable O-glycosylation ligase (exosortase A-associated)
LRDILLAIFLVPTVPLCFINPFFGVLMWAWISYFNPQQLTWGWGRSLPVGMLVAVATIAGLVITPRKRLPPITRETILLLLLWALFAVTTLNVRFSPDLVHHLDDSVSQFRQVSKILIMVFPALMLVNDPKRLRWWYLVTAGCFAFFAAKASIFGVLTGGQYRVYGPPNSMIEDNNDFALAINMCLPMFAYLGRLESRRVRLFFWLLFLFGVISVVLSYSRGGLLGLIGTLFVLTMKSRHKIVGIAGFVLIAIAVVSLAPTKWAERMQTISTAAQTDPSARGRINAWILAGHIAKDHPLTGGGFNTFTNELYLRYGLVGEAMRGPHSSYFQVLGEHGIPGLLLFLTLIASCLWSSCKLKWTAKRHRLLPYIGVYADIVQVSLLAYAISGAFLGRAYFDLFYQIVATAIILKMLTARELAAVRAEQRRAVPATTGPEETVLAPA